MTNPGHQQAGLEALVERDRRADLADHGTGVGNPDRANAPDRVPPATAAT